MANTKRFSLFIFLAVMVSSSFASFSPSNDYDYQRFLLKRIVSNKAIIESKAEFQNYNEIQVIGGNIIQWDRYNFKFYVPSQLSIRANKTGYLKVGKEIGQ